MDIMIEVSAPGNVFLLGEHSVVYERPALLASIGRRTYVSGEKRNDKKIKVKSEDYGEISFDLKELGNKLYQSPSDYKNEMDPIRDVIGYFDRVIKSLDDGFEARISSDIPKESGGQSSSTAVLTAFFRFLDELYTSAVSEDNYFSHLYDFQVRIHGGAASGSEFASSIFGGYNRVLKTPQNDSPVEFKNLGNLELDLVIGDTGIEAKTGKTVGHVRECWNKSRSTYESYFDQIADLVEGAERALRVRDLDKLGELMDKNHKILSERLEVSHPKLEELVEVARDAGASGAKLSGGGGGGIMVALCDEENKQRVAKAIEDAGGKAASTEVGVEGMRIED